MPREGKGSAKDGKNYWLTPPELLSEHIPHPSPHRLRTAVPDEPNEGLPHEPLGPGVRVRGEVTPPKSVATQAEEYVERTGDALIPNRARSRDAFLAGHAAGLAEAGEIVRAAQLFDHEAWEAWAEGDTIRFNDARVDFKEALSRFKALAGEK